MGPLGRLAYKLNGVFDLLRNGKNKTLKALSLARYVSRRITSQLK